MTRMARRREHSRRRTEREDSNETGADDGDTQQSSFRRLAAQLGLSHALQRIDESLPPARGVRRMGVDEDAHGDDTAFNVDEEDGRDGDDDDDDDDDESKLDSPLTPLRSDSASDSLSSDLSLPHSFGQYTPIRRKPLFDDHLQQAGGRGGDHGQAASGGSVAITTTGTGLQRESPTSNSTIQRSAPHGNGNDMMRRFYEAQVVKVRSQLNLVTQAHHQLEATLQNERQGWQRRLADSEHTLTALHVTLQRENDTLKRDVTQLQRLLEAEKEHFQDLVVSDALAAQLARQEEEQLSLKESVQLRVHGLLSSVKQEWAALTQERDELQRRLTDSQGDAASAEGARVQIRRDMETRIARLQHELEVSETSREDMEAQVASLYSQVEILKEEAAERVMEKKQARPAQAVEVVDADEKTRIEGELQCVQNELMQAKKKSEAADARIKELEQQVTLLSADKTFLSDAKQQLEAHEARLLSKQRELQSRIDVLTLANAQDARDATRVSEEARVRFEKQLEIEVAKFMELSKREIESIRSNGQAVYERENRLLCQARDDALKQIDMLQSRLQAVQATLDEKVLEMTRSESMQVTALAAVRNDLKMKHFEMTQLSISLEERIQELQASKQQVAMLEQKLEVHKDEFARLETTSTTRISQLETALEAERTKMSEYDQLEVDLDNAVLQTGAISGNQESPDKKDQLQDVMATFGAIPSSTKRRFQQSVVLAQRVVKHQREAIELQRRLTLAETDNQNLTTQIAELTRRINNLHQPQSYLIDKLSSKDDELRQLHEQNQHLQYQLKQLREEYQHATVAKMALQRQLQQVLTQREDLDALKTTVLALRKKLSVPQLEPMGKPPTNNIQRSPSPVGSVRIKNPPSPALQMLMTRTPPPSSTRRSESSSLHEQDTTGDQSGQRASPINNKSVDVDAPREQPGSSPSPPKWYIKLRS